MNRFREFKWLVGLGMILLASCNLDYFDFDKLSTEIELEPEIVAPLFYGTVTMEDLIEVIDSLGYTSVDEEGLIYIVYADTGFAVMADTVVDIPDKFVNKYYIESDITGNPGWGLVVGDTTYYEKLDTLSYGSEYNDRLDSVIVKAGILQIDVLSEFRHTGFLTISSSHIIDQDGKPFTTTFLISDLSGNFTDQQLFDMDGYQVNTEQTIDGDSTYIIIDFDLALIYSGNTVDLGEECQIDMSFLETDFYSVFGFIDQREVLNESGEVEIPLYENRPELADILFADPRINIYTRNSIGVLLELELDNMIATSSIDGSTVEMTFNGVNPFEIGAPDISQIGELVESQININNSTTNIDELLASAPRNISYDIIARTKYNSADDIHFVQDTSKLEMELEILLPLDLKTSGFALTDTIDFELFGNDGLDTSLINFLQINLGTDNGLPVELDVQLYFTDENYNVIDSLFDETAAILEAAPVNTATGIITNFSHADTPANLDNKKIANLYDVKYAIFQAKILTTNEGQDYVKIYTHYEGLNFEPAYALDFDLSIYGGFKINSQNTGN